MNKTLKLMAVAGLLLITASQANAGIFSKFRNWANTGWNNYGWGQGCPCYNNGYTNGYHNGHHHYGNRFFNNGAVTGFTPPITTAPGFYPSVGNYHSPINMNNRFDHLPNGMQTLNTPTQVITDFNSNFGTGTGVTIID